MYYNDIVKYIAEFKRNPLHASFMIAGVVIFTATLFYIVYKFEKRNKKTRMY